MEFYHLTLQKKPDYYKNKTPVLGISPGLPILTFSYQPDFDFKKSPHSWQSKKPRSTL